MQDVHCGYFKSCKHLIIKVLNSIYCTAQNLEEQNGDKNITATCKNLQKSEIFLFSGLLASKFTSKLASLKRSMHPKKEKSAPQ